MSGKAAAVPTEIACVCKDEAEASMLFEPAAAVTTVDDILRQKKSTRILAVRNRNQGREPFRRRIVAAVIEDAALPRMIKNKIAVEG